MGFKKKQAGTLVIVVQNEISQEKAMDLKDRIEAEVGSKVIVISGAAAASATWVPR